MFSDKKDRKEAKTLETEWNENAIVCQNEIQQCKRTLSLRSIYANEENFTLANHLRLITIMWWFNRTLKLIDLCLIKKHR